MYAHIPRRVTPQRKFCSRPVQKKKMKTSWHEPGPRGARPIRNDRRGEGKKNKTPHFLLVGPYLQTHMFYVPSQVQRCRPRRRGSEGGGGFGLGVRRSRGVLLETKKRGRVPKGRFSSDGKERERERERSYLHGPQ